MEKASKKVCHFCEKEIPEGFYIAISARHTSKEVHDIELGFHLECFEEVAGQDYSDQLAVKIAAWIEKRKVALDTLKKSKPRRHMRGFL